MTAAAARLLLPLLASLCCCLSSFAQRNPAERAAWNRPIKPFAIAGNVYYVGVEGVSAFLIATPEGAILIDGGFSETAPIIEKNIAELGFRLQDVRYLLNSHAHYDHCGGLAGLKSRSGAKLLASRGDTAPTGHLDCRDPIRPLTAVRVDRVIGDQETVRLGGVTLMAHLTPGHTKGCTTWSTTINDAGRSYRVVFYCSTTVAGNQLVNNTENPNIVADFEQTFAKLAAMPADIFLAPHGSFFNRDEKLEARRKGRKDAFVNSADLPAYVALSEKAFREELARQRAALTNSANGPRLP